MHNSHQALFTAACWHVHNTQSCAQPNLCREEGFLALWKGNSVLIIRIFPYSAAQLAANDTYKRVRVTMLYVDMRAVECDMGSVAPWLISCQLCWLHASTCTRVH